MYIYIKKTGNKKEKREIKAERWRRKQIRGVYYSRTLYYNRSRLIEFFFFLKKIGGWITVKGVVLTTNGC